MCGASELRGALSRERAMQDAALEALHSQLQAGESARGSHGGLGFDAKDGKKKKAGSETKAGKALLKESTSSGREFQTTTAGAVAAGHWDPFARPVEFKMKEANRRVGGLYSMFVKGGTVGATLPTEPSQAPSSATSASSRTPATETASAFNWKKAIRAALGKAPERQMRLKKLRREVLAEYNEAIACGANNTDDQARRKFKRRLKKASGVTLQGKVVRLTDAV